jgi:hypothetical protein
VLIKSLASTGSHCERQIRKVELLGAKSEVSWTRGPGGLTIRVPDDPPCYCFKILPA